MQMFRELRRNKIQFHYLINWREGNVCWMEMKWTNTTNRHWSIKRPSTILENDCHKLIYGHLKTTFDWPRPVNGRTDNDLLRYFFSLLASAECLRLTVLRSVLLLLLLSKQFHYLPWTRIAFYTASLLSWEENKKIENKGKTGKKR